MASRRSLALAAAVMAAALAPGKGGAPSAPWQKSAPVEIKRGDIVLRRGDGLWTQWFVDASTREKLYSHVGIAVTDGKAPMVVHSEADDMGADGRVKRDRWSVFQAGSFAAAAYRISDDPALRERIAQAAERRLGMPFDPSFSLADTNRLYCSQFVRDAVNEAAGREVIGVTMQGGVAIVAVDDCYANARKIFSAGAPPAPKPYGLSLPRLRPGRDARP